MIRAAAILCGVFATCAASTLAAERGFFTVEDRDGVSWFIDAHGRPFFSLGVSDMSPGPNRETYNADLPAYAAFKNYSSVENWADATTTRLKSWNFNTLGSWVHPSLTTGSLPYAEVLHLGAQVGTPWNDLFSDDFPAQIDKLAKARVAPKADDHNLIGWFTDNELGWYADTLFYFHLSRAKDSATRAKLLDLLRAHYGDDFSKLQQDFDTTDASSFDSLNSKNRLKLRPGGKGRSVILKFASAVATRYYSVVHDAIRRYDRHHLILGDRYAWNCPRVVAEAAGPYVDVISTNFDWPEATDGYLPCGFLECLHRASGRPVLVSEYYVAARENRSANKNSGGIFLTVADQTQRAVAAHDRLRLLINEPYVVGAHWFRYADEPTHGRTGDGEDYNFGLVDIQNEPYELLVNAMTRLNGDATRLHANSCKPSEGDPTGINVPFVEVETSKIHNQLLHTRSLGKGNDALGCYEFVAAWNPEKLYIAAMVCHLSERETYSGESTDGQVLELTIGAPNMERPVRVRFGGAGGAVPDNQQVKCWISSNGLRHTLVVPMPSKLLGKSALKENDQLSLELSLRDLRDEGSATLQSNCVLAAKNGELGNPDFKSDREPANATSR